VLAPISVLRTQDQDRLNIDVNVCQERIEQIKRCSGLGNKIADVFKTTFDITDTDPDRGIYSGGFFSEHDKHIFEQIRTKSVEKLTEFSPKFRDSRASEMYFRYRARNYPTTLSSEETKKWHEFCQKRLNGDETDGIMTFESFQNQINKLKSDNPEKKDFLDALAKWSVDKQSKLSNFAYH
jgi:exodeoxyribonuclease-1